MELALLKQSPSGPAQLWQTELSVIWIAEVLQCLGIKPLPLSMLHLAFLNAGNSDNSLANCWECY